MHSSGGIIFDLHSDIPADIALRRAQGERAVFLRRHARRLLASGVRAAVLAVWVEPAYRRQAAQRAIQIVGALLADLAESAACVHVVKDPRDLLRPLPADKVAVMLSVEGMSFVEQWPVAWEAGDESSDPAKIRPEASPVTPGEAGRRGRLLEQSAQTRAILRALGVQCAILTWGEQNAIASGPGQFDNPDGHHGLTWFGREVVAAWEQAGILIDVSHLDEPSTDGVLEAANGVVIASHSNARALCDHPRNLTDRHLRAIGERHGIVGVNAYARFVDVEHATLDRYVDHIVYIAERIGIEHVGLGFDFMDYLPDSFGFPERTQGLARVEDVPRLLERLSERGFSDRDIAMIAFDNACRVMRATSQAPVTAKS
ncbi:membrane dipeptidase [Alicyclobacillus cycloheptanicus]|uniref:Membrane dipeptidase n=1 Tax=Alicyclobacillus cycloheptanicus TaxID=1457 RepID=A0ABT9XJ56_9BACL|nr:membrane dipeptidase [Alicyclobacillus cycloheptanicus]MDQ0190342.1 membrane dipeptidase [Alicyclobacillus cycloheptanicus]WDM00018.1 membrane dipeptidase [Alicyclobacillus cycloheptanicus]